MPRARIRQLERKRLAEGLTTEEHEELERLLKQLAEAEQSENPHGDGYVGLDRRPYPNPRPGV
jgi:hypothetical protein